MKPMTRRYCNILYALWIGLILHSGKSYAMSVSWKGSTTIMGSNQPFLIDWLTAYSFRNDAALLPGTCG